MSAKGLVGALTHLREVRSLGTGVLWNSLYLDQSVRHLREEGEEVRGKDLSRVSPLMHAHVHFMGRYHFQAKVIVDGAETKADGGGLCQVTSTLYNAANFAGLDVLERTPHSAKLPYIRPGMDATVWWGGPGEEDDLDMKFRNTTNGYLLLREYVAEDGYVRADIWGRPNEVNVEMYSEPTDMGDDGSEWVTYQKVEKDGEILFDGVLHEDSYEPLVDEKGKEIPPSEVPVAPANP